MTQTILKNLGQVDYLPTMEAMQAFTEARTDETPDEIWVCQHPPTFTQGLAGKADHVLFNPPGPDHIPVVQTNRGGQVTYHGPGQVVAYPLLNLNKRGYFVKEYVYRLEEAIIRTLAHFGVTGHRVAGAPGIYVRLEDPFAHAALAEPRDPRDPFKGLGKIAALGIKVSRHCTYHGMALNVAMDLRPYDRINPCGYSGLRTIDMASIGVQVGWDEVAAVQAHQLDVRLAP
ncbi:MAG: lipoyl(octanoyl) transferase LipB [Aquabacterium sp.]|uniref:lipoyl(octanoyl) transferase LipB n=1 Tax=Aquabacterium sp. TaxID=1872578 RepID=UPI00120DD49A|nr:lipoyl(octanoyl) transferase LipB [Aquabacterium sp.]TAK93436.1 MAG: lipoyl(octanoyl) transferase LipB [Aquabacterium sp.]